MSQSRTVRRLLAAAASVPVVLTAAPLTGVAHAAVSISAGEHPLPSPRLVGPNAGFNDPARGINGFTPLYRFSVSDSTVGVSSVQIGLAGTTLNVFRDFDAGDGFSIFADAGNDGEFETACPELSTTCFDDFTPGPSSTGFAIGASSGGVTPVTITGRLESDPEEEEPERLAKGFTSYFVVIHPTSVVAPNRLFTPRLQGGGISTTDGGSGPASTLVSAPITLDSFAPPAPSTGNFSDTIRRPPMSATQQLEDGYIVSGGERNSEPGKKLAFFNNGTDTAVNGLLRRPSGALVIHDAPVFSTFLPIGDGTGITATVKVAKNNQVNNDVHVRSLDAAGNLSTATRLFTDELDTDSTAGPFKGNDVTAPRAGSMEVLFMNSSGTATNFVTATNVAAVPVRMNLNDVPWDGDHYLYNVSPDHGRVEARLVQVDGLNRPTDAATAWATATVDFGCFDPTCVLGSSAFLEANSSHNAGPFPDGARVIAQARAIDPQGNATDVIESGCTMTTPSGCDTVRSIPKDVVTPTIVAAVPALDVDNDGVLEAGDKLKVYFSEPMDTADIVERNAGNDCGPPDNIPPPADNDDPCVTYQLTLKDGAPSLTQNSVTVYDRVTFGGNAQPLGYNATTGTYAQPGTGQPGAASGPGFQWVEGASAAIITLATGGTQADPDGASGPGFAIRYPEVGDEIIPVANRISDRLGNLLASPVRIIDAGVIPLTSVTVDNVVEEHPMGLPTGQSGDGLVDVIRITFSNPLTAASVDAAEANFRVTSSVGTFTPDAVAVDSAFAPTTAPTSVVELRIPDEILMPGNETPVVSLLGATAAATGLLRSNGAAVPPFTILTSDAAPPRMRDAKTRDANNDGKIDTIALQYSETIDHAKMNSRGYVITGYTDIAPTTNPANGAVLAGLRSANTFTPTTGQGTTQTVNLLPKAAPDTGVLPAGLYSRSLTTEEANLRPTVGLQDLATPPNYGAWSMSLIPDGAAPVAVSALTRDTDSDGKLDAVDVKFSEGLSSSSTNNGTWTVEGHNVTRSFAVAFDTVRVLFDETGDAFTGDSDLKPPVKYTGGIDGGVRDDQGGTPAFVPAAEAPGITPADGAGPAIVGATLSFEGNTASAESPTSTSMRVLFSEPVAAVTPAAFVVSQAGIDTATVSAATLSADKKSADLTIDPAFDRFKDSSVGFAPDADVKDAVTPTGNSRTQTEPVTAFAYPTALLDVTGPAGSAAGSSTSRTVSTGAAGTGSITGWCIRISNKTIGEADPTVPEAGDACFQENAPYQLGPTVAPGLSASATPTIPIDGTYAVLLVTRDRFNNISLPAVDSIVIDSTAPVIGALAFRNFTTGSTTAVRDADQVFVDATATGTGASAFTATIDYRNITGNPNDGARAGTVRAVSSTSKTFRFPFVTASGTTVYPVGTVLKSDSGLPFILEDEDSGDGVVVRRRFISAQAMSTYRIPSSLVITVPAAVTNAIPVGPAKPYRDGILIRATGTPAVYVITEGKRYQFTSRAEFQGLGFEFADVLSVPAADVAKVPTYTGSPFGTAGVTHPVGTYVRNTNNGATYAVVKNSDGEARIRRIVSSTALNSLAPLSQVINVPETHPTLLLPQDGFNRGLRDGMLVRFLNDPRVFVVSRGQLRHINSRAAFELMGFSFRNVVTVRHADAGIATIGTPVSTRQVAYAVTFKDQAGNASTKTGSVTALGVPVSRPNPGSNAALP